ncbi:hypothetical protein DERP_007005 [Dermatophagoides pteronyssinus]|uniref:Uncharacterized protein n=1 Tax=Dermatophagoides pteronyssinus TaxID=6956 RepID=A0ABQ8JTV9_DERPT|nr:hypothetical protein DERP_007005 [Dermatophagoides pteronyssinus]
MNKSSPTIAAGVANVKVDGVKYDADVDVDDEPLMVRTLPPKLKGKKRMQKKTCVILFRWCFGVVIIKEFFNNK